MSERKRFARRIASKDALAGALFGAIGLTGVVLARALPVGEAARMGPGYMPLAFSWLLAGLGLLIVARATLAGSDEEAGATGAAWRIRPIGAVLASVVLFGLTVERLGLALAVALVVVAASLASPETRRGEVALLASGLSAFSALLFVELLGLPIKLWPW